MTFVVISPSITNMPTVSNKLVSIRSWEYNEDKRNMAKHVHYKCTCQLSAKVSTVNSGMLALVPFFLRCFWSNCEPTLISLASNITEKLGSLLGHTQSHVLHSNFLAVLSMLLCKAEICAKFDFASLIDCGNK